jgi:hypothetical protein
MKALIYIIRGHKFRRGNYGAGAGDKRKCDGLFLCLTYPTSADCGQDQQDFIYHVGNKISVCISPDRSS